MYWLEKGVNLRHGSTHAVGLQGYPDIPDFYSENPAGANRITYWIFQKNLNFSFWNIYYQLFFSANVFFQRLDKKLSPFSSLFLDDQRYDLRVGEHNSEADAVEKQNVLEPIERMACNVAVKHYRLLVVPKEHPFINPVRG